jgi:hypothetical protein
MRFKSGFALGAALMAVILAQPALAGTVSLVPGHDGTNIVFEAAVGEINDVSVVEGPDGVYSISDSSAVITLQTTGCVSVSPNAVRCQVRPAFEDSAVVFTRDGADSVNVSSRFALVRGGPGPDTLSGAGYLTSLLGGLGDDRLIGHSGDQQLRGGAGTDLLEAGPGDDILEGGAGTDVILGGSGNDNVSYEDHKGPVTISLDGRANDGAAGENDLVRAVESVQGSRGPTTFIGNANSNEFSGSSARDLVRAGPGDDLI